MPELPDVEAFRRYLDATSLHKKIRSVSVKDPEMLESLSPSRLKRRLQGHSFRSTRRHGKYLFAETDDASWLVLHFAMTGFLKYFKSPHQEPEHDRLLMRLSNGYSLAYDCQRKLGKIELTADPEAFVSEYGLGVDALAPELDLATFTDLFSRSRGTVKNALMNQNLLAGVGNVYSDEILFQAGIDPRARTNVLSEDSLGKIFRAMREDVLPTAIDAQAEPSRFPDRYLTRQRREGGTCPRCGGELAQEKVSGRTAYLCRKCQRRRS